MSSAVPTLESYSRETGIQNSTPTASILHKINSLLQTPAPDDPCAPGGHGLWWSSKVSYGGMGLWCKSKIASSLTCPLLYLRQLLLQSHSFALSFSVFAKHFVFLLFFFFKVVFPFLKLRNFILFQTYLCFEIRKKCNWKQYWRKAGNKKLNLGEKCSWIHKAFLSFRHLIL